LNRKDDKKKIVHQGELLKKLAAWYNPKSDATFYDAIGRSNRWFYDNIVYERISEKNITLICRKINIPPEYFDGTFELPRHLPAANEPQAEYATPYKMLEEENQQLRKELNDLQRKHIELHEQIKILLEQKKDLV